jgi:hypothetical protein
MLSRGDALLCSQNSFALFATWVTYDAVLAVGEWHNVARLNNLSVAQGTWGKTKVTTLFGTQLVFYRHDTHRAMIKGGRSTITSTPNVMAMDCMKREHQRSKGEALEKKRKAIRTWEKEGKYHMSQKEWIKYTIKISLPPLGPSE